MQRLGFSETPGFPRCVEVQTINVCNARCGVCPYEEVSAETARHRMPDELLNKILAECAAHRDELALFVPYLNNEPFADTRMLHILRTVQETVRRPVELSTNASLLTNAIADAIVNEALVSTLRVSAFGAYPETYEQRMAPLKWGRFEKHLSYLLASNESRGGPVTIEIVMVGTSDLSAGEVEHARELWTKRSARVRIFGFLDRAGNGQERNLLPLHQGVGRVYGCELNRPFERMAILADGRCVLCSQDWRSEVILGDASRDSISSIWHGSTAWKVRGIVSGLETAPPDFLCRRCKLAYVE